MLDRRERTYDPEETTRLFLRSLQSSIWTGLPAQILRFYPADMTVDVQPVLNCLFTNSAGEAVDVQLPVLPKVPCQFPGGGGATLTWTPVAGEECWVTFGARSIDSWWTYGFQTPQALDPITGRPVNSGNTPVEQRMHNLSDGVALLGYRNKTRAYAPLTGGTQLQSDDGQTYVQLNPTTHVVNVLAAGGINLNGVTIDASGNINTEGNVKAIAGAAFVDVANHTHSGGGSGPPNPGT